MDSYEINKIAGAVLGAVLILFGLNAVLDKIFHVEAPEKPGYAIAVTSDNGKTAQKKVEPSFDSSLSLVSTADVAAGKKVTKKCIACHTFDAGGKAKSGPNLWNIVNRSVASDEGFKYSSAMKAFSSNNNWNFETLDRFLAKPKKLVKGTIMGFAGVKKKSDRAALLRYLQSLSDNPVPLP